MMETIHELPQPVIAKVHGIATAAGCQLVAACDLAVAAERARGSRTPGVKIGLFCSTPMVPVSRAVGRKRAMEMLLTGEPIDAETALDWGLVNRVVPASELDSVVAAGSWTRSHGRARTPSRPASARSTTRSTGPSTMRTSTARTVMTENALAADAQEGMSAFLQKRPPTWTGR